MANIVDMLGRAFTPPEVVPQHQKPAELQLAEAIASYGLIPPDDIRLLIVYIQVPQRQTAALPLDLSAMQKRAEHDVRLRCNLSEAAMIGVPGAAKAKRKLNDVWTNRASRNLTGFWRPV